MAQITGGGNSLRLHKVTTNTAASGVIYLATYHEFDQTISTTLSKTETGFTLSLDQIKSDATVLTTFLEEAISSSAAVGESVVYEDGIELSASSNNQTYLAIVIGGAVSDSTDRLVWAGLMTADAAATGSVSFTANTYVRPSVSFATIAAASAITLSTTIFNSVLVSQIALTVIPYTRKTGRYMYVKNQV
jgi:hypothetical protein